MTDPVMLNAKLDLPAAAALMNTLQERSEAEVVVDFAEVKHLGALCLQVLISAAKTAAADNRKITLTNASDRVIDQMRVMGMTPEAIAKGQ